MSASWLTTLNIYVFQFYMFTGKILSHIVHTTSHYVVGTYSRFEIRVALEWKSEIAVHTLLTSLEKLSSCGCPFMLDHMLKDNDNV